MKKEKQSISELQQTAAEALNNLQKALKAGNYKVITPAQMLGTAFRMLDDENAGFRFVPVDLTEAEGLKYNDPDDEDDKRGGLTITKPSKPKYLTIHHATSTPRMVMKGVRAETEPVEEEDTE